MRIWIVNPFDDLPNETDVPLRYWGLCRRLAQAGHDVVWWSSTFSHRRKARRQACESCDGFQIRLVETCPYSHNISLARLRNHRQFVYHWQRDAHNSIVNGQLAPPERILVSSPPLGLVQRADIMRRKWGCTVILDIMDAWPETFYRVLPLPTCLRIKLGNVLFKSMHSTMTESYRMADSIIGVSAKYLNKASAHALPGTPQLLCYHGIEHTRIIRPHHLTAQPIPLRLIYLGAMEASYDLLTPMKGLAELRHKGYQVVLHLAGAGTRQVEFRRYAENLLGVDRVCDWHEPHQIPHPDHPAVVFFHGYLNRTGLQQLGSAAHVGLIPMDPGSGVAVPYKFADYSAFGLAMLSCLGGEAQSLIHTYCTGTAYSMGNVSQWMEAVEIYLNNFQALNLHRQNSHRMCGELFDRDRTYEKMISAIVTASRENQLV